MEVNSISYACSASSASSTSSTLRMEEMNPDEFTTAMEKAPVAYVPMGTLEFHGYHLPIGNDALKAHAICIRAAQVTGGVVLPPVYWGTGGGHKDYVTSIIVDDAVVRSGLEVTLTRLEEMGFRAIVVLTGHYPGEQVELVKQTAALVEANSGGRCSIWAGPEPEAYPGYPVENRSDHAALWETSILMELRPELVKLHSFEAHSDNPYYGIYGESPLAATSKLGEETVDEVVSSLARWVEKVLKEQ